MTCLGERSRRPRPVFKLRGEYCSFFLFHCSHLQTRGLIGALVDRLLWPQSRSTLLACTGCSQLTAGCLGLLLDGQFLLHGPALRLRMRTEIPCFIYAAPVLGQPGGAGWGTPTAHTVSAERGLHILGLLRRQENPGAEARRHPETPRVLTPHSQRAKRSLLTNSSCDPPDVWFCVTCT